MLKRAGLTVFAFLFNIANAYSEEITITFSGQVNYVGAPLASVVEVSSEISGSYSFDARAPDLISSSRVGLYRINAMQIASDGLTAESDGDDIVSGILIIDSDSQMDIYKIQAYGDIIGSEIEEYVPLSLRIYLVFPGNKFSNDSLPTTAINLNDALQAEFEMIFKKDASFSSMSGMVTSLEARQTRSE